MAFHPFEVNVPHIVYTCLGAFVVLFGMFSLVLRERLYIGEACWAFLFGVIIGPYGANIFNPHAWGSPGRDPNPDLDSTNAITLESMRVVLAIGVFAIGVELPKAYMKRHWKSLFFLLGPIMTWGWFVSAGLIFALVPGLNFLSSLAVAACLTPTDPILAAAIVGGKYADKHVPAHLRHLLAAESGCNDGAAFPFLYIALYLIISPTVGEAIKNWFLLLWLYQIILGVVFGALLGFAFRYLLKFCQRHSLIDRHSYVAQYVSLALFATGSTALLGSDDLLCSFVCGTSFAWDGFFNKQTEESNFSSVIDLLFNIAAFVYVGAWMPFSSFSDASLTLSVWRLVVIGILVILLRRIPIMCALYKWIPDIKTFREAVFSGHFGPMGVGAVFISTLAAQVLLEHIDENPEEAPEQTKLLAKAIQPIVAFMVLCSIVTHGLSIPGFSLGKRVHTVSRTWSRHASLPEWVNQVRRSDNIVISRDRDDEGTGTVVEVDEDNRRLDDLERGAADGSPISVEKAEEKDDAMKNEEPPDGDDLVTEWQEGPHKVIERREGPGEEVSVEVIRNFYSPSPHPSDGSDVVTRFTGSPTQVHTQVNLYMDKLRSALNHAGHGYHHDHNVLEKVESAISGHSPETHPDDEPQSDNDHVTLSAEGDGDEDEGWASEASAGSSQMRTGRDSSSATSLRPKSRSPRAHSGRRRPPKLGTPPQPPSFASSSKKSPGKRKSSIRRGLLKTAGNLGKVFGSKENLPVDDPSASANPSTALPRLETSSSLQSHSSPDTPLSPSSPISAGEDSEYMLQLQTPSPTMSPPVVSPSLASPRSPRSPSSPNPINSGGRTGRSMALRHSRIDSIRSDHSIPSSREVSPTRSVRFFDEMPSRPRSPSIPRGSPTPPENEDDASSPGDTSAKNRVTFELPA